MPDQQYFLKLIPPRATFPGDMNDRERTLMQEHAVYMRGYFEARKLLIYGPVMAPGGAFGMGVMTVSGEAEARRIMDDDPTVRAGLNRYEISPMTVAAARSL